MTDDIQPRLRHFGPGDATAVTGLFLQVGREIAPPSMQAQLAHHIAEVMASDYRDIGTFYAPARGRGFWVVVAGDGSLLGNYGLLPGADGEAELRRFLVSPAARGHGIARLMLEDAERRCRAWGFERLVLSTSELHVAAMRLYRRAGFEETRTAVVDLDGVALRVFHLAKRLAPALAA